MGNIVVIHLRKGSLDHAWQLVTRLTPAENMPLFSIKKSIHIQLIWYNGYKRHFNHKILTRIHSSPGTKSK